MAAFDESQKPTNYDEIEQACEVVNDIGLYAGLSATIPLNKLSDGDKLNLLNNHWKPPLSYDMPYSTRITKGKQEKRFLRHDHLERYKFLAFSQHCQGLFCKACVLFGPLAAGRSRCNLQKLVTEPLKQFDRLFGSNGYITCHENAEYHKTAVLKTTNFVNAMTQRRDIQTHIDTARIKQIEENRQRLIPIISTILLCGRQNIPLRGHRDSGSVEKLINEDSLVKNEGNFRALLKYRIDGGDLILRQHLDNAVKNATYISKTTQNDIITTTGNIIRNKIIERVRNAKFFSVLVDETTDLSKQEQMTMCLRYVTDNHLCEDFIDFISVSDMTGVGLANTILSRLKQFQLDLTYLVGQGYDGASAMSGIFNGVQAIIRDEFPAASYVHCASHSLNLTLSSACKLSQIRNTHGIIGEVAVFFNRSAKRVDLLRQCIQDLAPETKKKRLVQLCETRWVERHDAVITFVELFNCVLLGLDRCGDLDVNTSSKANMMNNSIRKSEFLVAVVVLESVLAVTLPLSQALQKSSVDLIQALSNVVSLKNLLLKRRNNAEREFADLWLQIETLAKQADVSLSIPRQAAHQTKRANIPSNSAVEYFRRSLYIPFLDNIIQELTDRFLGHSSTVFYLNALIPASIKSYSFVDVRRALDMYSKYIQSEKHVQAEYDLWKQKWLEAIENDLPANAIDALPFCSEDFFPNIRILLTITATIPVTTATAERTFSSLKLIKTYLRTTMGQERLTGLALLYIHRDIAVTVDEIIDSFARHCSRRLEFII
jgi:hypothetical protein